MKARFRVQHQILSGLKYVQVVSRMGVKNKMQEMIVGFLFPSAPLSIHQLRHLPPNVWVRLPQR